jgi:hypothetical protein
MILMALCAVLCGADTWVDVAEEAEDNDALLRQDYQYPKRSQRSRRKTADRIPHYRASLPGLVAP